MAGDTRHTKYRLRAERQEALRDYLSNKCSLEHIVDSINKIENDAISMEPQELQGKKIALEARLKLLAKYLPDQKAIELQQDPEGEGLIMTIKRVVIDPNAPTPD